MTPSLARNVNSAQAIKVGGQEHGCRSDTKWSGNVLTLHPHVERNNYSVITITTLVSKYVALDANRPIDAAIYRATVPAQLNHRIEVGFFSILLHYADAFGATDVVSERGDGAIERVRALTQHMQDVFKRVNAMSKAPLEFIWLEELAP